MMNEERTIWIHRDDVPVIDGVYEASYMDRYPGEYRRFDTKEDCWGYSARTPEIAATRPLSGHRRLWWRGLKNKPEGI